MRPGACTCHVRLARVRCLGRQHQAGSCNAEDQPWYTQQFGSKSSLDQIGPFAKTVEDAALLLEVISGHDSLDSTSFPCEVPNYGSLLKEKKVPSVIGLPKEFFGDGMDSEVRIAVEKTIEFYRKLGHKIIEISFKIYLFYG